VNKLVLVFSEGVADTSLHCPGFVDVLVVTELAELGEGRGSEVLSNEVLLGLVCRGGQVKFLSFEDGQLDEGVREGDDEGGGR